VNHAIFENVRPEASSVSECLQYAIVSDALKMITWFTQPIPSTDGVTDPESLSNEVIECDITGFDVPSVFARCEFDSRFTFDCYNSLLLNQREVVPIVAFLVRLPLDEGPGFDFTEISVTSKATSSDGLSVTAFGHFDFGFRSSEDSFDSSNTIHTHRVLVLYQMACVCVR
jgi:hypothetical protein